MNLTEALRIICDAAAVQFAQGDHRHRPDRKLFQALKKYRAKLKKLESRLETLRAKRRTSKDRPKCLQDEPPTRRHRIRKW